MKYRLPHSNQLPYLFNLGLHRQKELISIQWENSSYQRKAETLENPIRKSVQLAEFASFFWAILETEGNIAIINTNEPRAFSYENWFEGTRVKCYEGSWIPGLWRNPLLRNPLPDLVLLLSVKWNERSAILGELQNLNIPVINFSSEPLEWNYLTLQLQEQNGITHFYMQLIRFLLLRFQHGRRRSKLAPELNWEEVPLRLQIRRLVTHFCEFALSSNRTPSQKVWPPCRKRSLLKRLKKSHIYTKHIYLKGKKGSS
jgi:hypothetical protein